MAKAVSSIFVKLSTNATEFISGLRRSTKAAQNFGRTVARLAKRVLSLRNVVFGLVGAAGFGAFLTVVAQTNIALSSTAEKLGVTEQALAGLQHAAALTNVDSGKLNLSLQRMTRRVAEAAQGTGEAQGALRELGLSAERLNRLTPDQKFIEIAGAMEMVKNQSDRVRLGFKLFDSEGVDLIRTLDLGAEGLAAMAAEAELLNTALTGVEARKLDMADQAITRMKASITGVGNAILSGLTPLIIFAANWMTELAKRTNNYGDIGQAVFRGITKGIGFMADSAQKMTLIWTFMKSIFAEIGAAFWQMINGIGEGVQSLIQFFDSDFELPGLATIAAITQEATRNVENLRNEFQRLFNEPPPSEGLMLMFDEVAERVQLQAEILQQQREEQIAASQKADQKNALMRIKLEKEVSKQITSMRTGVWKLSAQLLQQFAGESRAAAIAAIAINKGLSIAQAVQNTAVAVTKALTVDPTGALAARVSTLGAIQIGLIAATGLAQAANVGTGGASAGSVANPINVASQETSLSQVQGDVSEAGRQRGLTVQIVGDVFGFDDFSEKVGEAVKDLTDRDVVVIDKNTAQGAEIGNTS